jgi:deoxyribonuclease-4
MTPLNIGGHLSLNGNPRATVRSTAEQGFRSMQIFASSPGAWKPPIVDPARARDFVAARRKHGVDPLFIHAIYLINLASPNPVLMQRSRDSLAATLLAGAELGAAGVVTHIGSHGGRGFERVAEQISSILRDILASTPVEVQLLLENSAGAGGIIGSDLLELSDLIARTGSPPRLKVALDTAHLCGAGWSFAEERVAERLVEDTDRHIGLERLALIHANDSARPCGSRKDRHANIGEGHIGLEGFRHLLAQPALRQVPWILETPDLDRRVDDRARLEALSVESVEAVELPRGA